MIQINDLIDGTAVNVPAHIQRLFKLANEALMTECDLEEAPDEPRIERIWQASCVRTVRRMEALEVAIDAHNRQELLVEVMVCGS